MFTVFGSSIYGILYLLSHFQVSLLNFEVLRCLTVHLFIYYPFFLFLTSLTDWITFEE